VRTQVVAMLCLTLSGFTAANAAAPARPEPFRLEHALTLKSFSDLNWSADGTKLAFVVTTMDTAENTSNPDLWLADLARGETLRLTRHPKADISPTFSPGGDTLAFVANRGTGEDAKPAIWMMSLRGGEPWAFGSYAEAVGEVKWSPDGRTLAYVMTDTLSRQIREWRKKKWDQVVEDERLQYPHLWVVDVATGRQRRLTSGDRYIWNVRWSPDSRLIAFIVSPTGKPDDSNEQDIGIVPAEGGPVRTLGVIGGAFAWSPDGKSIALATGHDRDVYVGKTDLWRVPVAGGAPRNLTAGFDEDAQMPAWNPSGDTLYFHADRGVSTTLASVAARDTVVTLGVDRAGTASTPAIAANGRAAWVQSRATAPSEIWIADHVGLPGRALTALNTGVARLALGTTRSVRWTGTDGVRVEGVLLRPAGAPERAALKTLVLLHGGPYTERWTLGFQSTAQYFAANGYQVFMPNFRSSGGYGTAFMVRTRSNWGGQDWRDVTSGLDSLIARGLVDGRQLGVFGHSYGGYLSAWAITQTDRFEAACVSAGAVDLAAHWGQSDIHKYRAYDFEGFPWATPDLWARSSPSSYILHAKTPTLVFSGEDDRRVPYPQGQMLYQSLLALNVPTEFVHYPREPHGYREYHHQADRLMRELAWFNRWVR
jgi:dipeptidyl aminopeptidase/acylaminoacyl peptidase